MKLTPQDYFIFSGGEVHCRVNNTADISRIVCMDYTMNGFMALANYKEVLDRRGITTKLIYPYFPYARQDRVMQDNEPFSLKVFCKLLNSLKFQSVTVWDPHSDVVAALVDNCIVIEQHALAMKVIPSRYFDSPVLWVSPDAGAYKKLSKLIPMADKIAIGIKKRDYEGTIIHTDVFSSRSINGEVCIIVDDICDGGRTFIELAKTLKQKGANAVILYVTHGIFSKGLSILHENGIDHVYTTNSIPTAAALGEVLADSTNWLTVVDII